jgi:hypothetical protein
VPGGEDQARERLDAYLTAPKPIPTVAQAHENDETPVNTGVLKYRYRDSNPGFRRERVSDRPVTSPKIAIFQAKRDWSGPLKPAECSGAVRIWFGQSRADGEAVN